MSEGGTIKGQLEQVERELQEEFKIWDSLGVIIADTYRMNNTEWIHHIGIMTAERVIKEKLGLSNDEWQLFMKKTMLEEAKKFRPIIEKARSDAIKRQIIDGVIIKNPMDGQL